jgi:hypothetical protein
MKRQLINLTGKPIRFLTLPTLKAGTAPLEAILVMKTPEYAINGIPVFTGAWITTREVPPLPKPCRHCGGGTCRECDGFGFDRDAPIYIVSEEVRITHGNRRDFFSVFTAVNGEVISLRGPSR